RCRPHASAHWYYRAVPRSRWLRHACDSASCRPQQATGKACRNGFVLRTEDLPASARCFACVCRTQSLSGARLPLTWHVSRRLGPAFLSGSFDVPYDCLCTGLDVHISDTDMAIAVSPMCIKSLEQLSKPVCTLEGGV